MLGFGMVLPWGKYDDWEHVNQGLSIGNNIWDFAPSVAFTYTSPPILAEGTEISAKLYWNNYLTNPATQNTTGTLLNVDFAVSERIGRFQVGLAGLYAVQWRTTSCSVSRSRPTDDAPSSLALAGCSTST